MEPGNMGHGGEAARPTALGSTNLAMTGAVQGGEANIGTGTFDGSTPRAAAARRARFDVFNLSEPYAYGNSAEFARQVRAAADLGDVPVAVFLREPGPGVAYANSGEFWRQLGSGPAGAVLVGVQLPDGVVPAHDNYGYSPLHLLPRPGAGRFVVLGDLLPGGAGAAYNGDYAPQPRPVVGRGEVVLVDLDLLAGGANAPYNGAYALQPRPGAGRGVVVPVDLDLLPGGGGAAYNGEYALQPHPGAGRGEVVLVDLDLLPDGIDAAYNGYYAWQPRPGAGSGEVFTGPLPDGGVGVVFDNSGNFAQQSSLQGAGRADGIACALRGHSLGPGYPGSGAPTDDLGGAVYDNPGVVAEHLRRLLGFVGIGACSVAVNGLAAGPGAPADAFHLFALLLVGLFLVIMHVLRV